MFSAAPRDRGLNILLYRSQLSALRCRPVRQENQRPPDLLTLSSRPCMKATFAIWKRQTALELRSGSGLPRLAAPAGYRAVRVDDGPPVVGLLRQAQRSMQQPLGLIQFALHGAELRAEIGQRSGTEPRNPFSPALPCGAPRPPGGRKLSPHGRHFRRARRLTLAFFSRRIMASSPSSSPSSLGKMEKAAGRR